MALTFELSEPTTLAAGYGLVNFSINSGPKLAITVHRSSATKVDAILRQRKQAGNYSQPALNLSVFNNH